MAGGREKLSSPKRGLRVDARLTTQVYATTGPGIGEGGTCEGWGIARPGWLTGWRGEALLSLARLATIFHAGDTSTDCDDFSVFSAA